MLSLLESIWHGILDIPYLAVGFLVTVFNSVIAGFAALATAVVSLLPSFPSAPTAPGGVVGGLLWFLPLGTILSFFSLMVTCWIGFLAIKAALRWVKVL